MYIPNILIPLMMGCIRGIKVSVISNGVFFHKILSCPYEELKYHPVVNLLAESKYMPYRVASYFELVIHCFFIFVLAFALISASYTCETELFLYNDTLSWCRLVCEILSLIFITAFTTMTFLNFISEWFQVSSYNKVCLVRVSFIKKRDIGRGVSNFGNFASGNV